MFFKRFRPFLLASDYCSDCDWLHHDDHIEKRQFCRRLGPTQDGLRQKIADLLKQPGLLTAPVKNERQTFGDVIEVFKHRIEGSNLEETTKYKKLCVLNSLLDSWRKVPDFTEDLRDLRGVSPKQLHFDQWVAWRAFFLAPRAKGGLARSNDYCNQARSIVCELYKIARERNPLLENLGEKLDFGKAYPARANVDLWGP